MNIEKEMTKPLINRVAQSGLITINMEDWFPNQPIEELDLKEFLFHGLILKEQEFRDKIKSTDWEAYTGSVLCVYCSTDAIIPVWAFMLIAASVASHADDIHYGDASSYITNFYKQKIDNTDFTSFEGQRLVIKGCGKKPVPASAYMYITRKLKPIAQSIMYGEPCSTVPVFKKSTIKA